MKPVIRPATLADVVELAETMCDADKAEIFHLNGNTPLQELTACFSHKDTYTVEHEGCVIAMLGVISRDSVGVPWMLSTDRTHTVTSLAREARRMVKQWAAQHGYLTNVVWAENKPHLRWLDWLGFSLLYVLEHNGQKFVRFEMTSE